MREFKDKYVVYEEDIKKKLSYSDIMSFTCIAIVMMSGALMLPLILKLTMRVIQLMKIFFSMNPTQIELQLKDLKSF